MYLKDIVQGIAERIILLMLKYMDTVEGQRFLKRVCLENAVVEKQEIILMK
jgi:hypothetical protein